MTAHASLVTERGWRPTTAEFVLYGLVALAVKEQTTAYTYGPDSAWDEAVGWVCFLWDRMPRELGFSGRGDENIRVCREKNARGLCSVYGCERPAATFPTGCYQLSDCIEHAER